MEENKVPDWPYFKDEKVRNLIDDELRKMQTIESNLGKDSSKQEKAFAKQKQQACMKRIWELDVEFYNDRIKPKKEL